MPVLGPSNFITPELDDNGNANVVELTDVPVNSFEPAIIPSKINEPVLEPTIVPEPNVVPTPDIIGVNHVTVSDSNVCSRGEVVHGEGVDSEEDVVISDSNGEWNQNPEHEDGNGSYFNLDYDEE